MDLKSSSSHRGYLSADLKAADLARQHLPSAQHLRYVVPLISHQQSNGLWTQVFEMVRYLIVLEMVSGRDGPLEQVS